MYARRKGTKPAAILLLGPTPPRACVAVCHTPPDRLYRNPKLPSRSRKHVLRPLAGRPDAPRSITTGECVGDKIRCWSTAKSKCSTNGAGQLPSLEHRRWHIDHLQRTFDEACSRC